MNCHRAHQLVSPYLDHQLTGAEMLEIQQHLGGCRSCAEEYEAARHIKSLLRSLRVQEPVGPLDARIAQRVTQQDGAFSWALPTRPAPPRPQAGRRLTAALALSCVALFAITPSFAPPARDSAAGRAPASAGLGQIAFREQTPGLTASGSPSLLLAHSATNTGGNPTLSPAVWAINNGAQDERPVGPDAPPPLMDVGAEPLGDPAADGFVALADYRTR